MGLKIIFLVAVILATSSCKKDKVIPDPCAVLVDGYVVGFNQCAIGQSFILALTNSRDTVETFNFPDSVYHFPKTAADPLYGNYLKDFLFPKIYQGTFPVSISYDVVPEAERRYVICANQYIGHYTRTVATQVKLKCVRKK